MADPSPMPSPVPPPAVLPSEAPTQFPTTFPTVEPTTHAPSPAPTPTPTFLPTPLPTHSPTPFPTPSPTPVPTPFPVVTPTAGPSQVVSIPDDDTLLEMMIAYGAITLTALVIYACLVRARRMRWLFEPKGSARFSDIFQVGRFGSLSVRESDFVARCGLDAYMSLRNIGLSCAILFGYLVLAGTVLLPSYRLQHRTDRCIQWCSRQAEAKALGAAPLAGSADMFESGCACTIVDRYSLANIAPESEHLWLPVVGIVGVTVVCMALLRREYQQVVRLRASYWLSMPPEMFTVLIDDIPAHLNLHTEAKLRAHFDKLFPGKVVRVDPARFRDETVLKQLRRAGDKRMAAFDHLDRLIALQREYGTDSAPRCHSMCINSCTSRTPLSEQISHWRKVFHERNRAFEEQLSAYRTLEMEERNGNLARPLISAFITFSSPKVAAIATQSVVDHRFNVVTVLASEPDDLRWDSLGYGEHERGIWTWGSRMAFFVLVVFWGAFTSVVGAMTSVEALESRFEGLHKFFEDNEWLRGLLEQTAPLVLTALMAIVNPIISLLARVEARASEGDADNVATLWYFIFLILQVFLFYGVSGSLLKSIDFDHPSAIVGMLGSNIPRMASFYLNFFITKFVTSIVVDLLRITDLALHLLRRVLFGAALSNRDQRTARCGCHIISFPAHRNLSSLNGQMLLLFFIATTYAVIQPLLIPLAFVFFLLAYFCYAKLLVSCNMQRYDSGGRLWTRTYWCYVAALLVSQLTLVGLLGIKKAVTQPAIVSLLFFATWFAAAMIDFRYRRLVLDLPLDLTTQVESRIDPAKPGKMTNASVWRYGELSCGEPNYYGRYLAIKSNKKDPAFRPTFHETHAGQRDEENEFLSESEPGTPIGGDDETSESHGRHGSESGMNDDESQRRLIEDDGLPSPPGPPPPRPPRTSSVDANPGFWLGPNGGSGDSFSARNDESQRLHQFEYYSYSLPVLREPPLLELDNRNELLDVDDSEPRGASGSLHDPLLVT